MQTIKNITKQNVGRALYDLVTDENNTIHYYWTKDNNDIGIGYYAIDGMIKVYYHDVINYGYKLFCTIVLDDISTQVDYHCTPYHEVNKICKTIIKHMM